MAEGDVELGHVDTDNTVQLLLKTDRFQRCQSPGWISMVPKVYRDLSPHSYTPRVVSIGPLHHKNKHLIGFEAQKATYMHSLLHHLSCNLDSTPEQILKECVTKVSHSVDQIKAWYVAMPILTDSKLVKMMVTDACFILSFLYDFEIGDSSIGPIELLYEHIALDMVLIENQIPIFVLQDIFECTLLKLYPTQSLAHFIFPLQNFCNIFDGDLVMDNSDISTTHVHHILGFLHKYYQNPNHDQSRFDKQILEGHSVVELDRSGVRFSNKLDANANLLKREGFTWFEYVWRWVQSLWISRQPERSQTSVNQKPWPMAMELEISSFLCFPNLSWSKPTLKMPVLVLHDNTELIIRNLVMYEQFFGVQGCVRSYIYALDFLIDTPQDVAKLVKSKALINILGSDEEAVGIINNLGKQLSVRDFFYKDEWEKMNKHYNATWPKFIADLRRTYFNNPWSIIAVLAGIVLFVVTVIQTIYGVKAA